MISPASCAPRAPACRRAPCGLRRRCGSTWIVTPFAAVTTSCGLIGARADVVLGDREPAVDCDTAPRSSREREQRADRDGAALHVLVHVVHALVRLEIDAAGVETDALADERDVRRAPLRAAAADSAGARCRRRAAALPRATARNAPAPSARSAASSSQRICQPVAARELARCARR